MGRKRFGLENFGRVAAGWVGGCAPFEGQALETLA